MKTWKKILIGIAILFIAIITISTIISEENRMEENRAYHQAIEDGDENLEAIEDEYHQQYEEIRENRKKESEKIRKENGIE